MIDNYQPVTCYDSVRMWKQLQLNNKELAKRLESGYYAISGIENLLDLFNEPDLYPGNIEQVKNVLIPYCRSLMRLSPTPDDLTRRGVLSVDDDTLLSAMYQVPHSYHNDHVGEKWDIYLHSTFE